MSYVRLNILDAQREITGTVHGGEAQAIVAALSADPETIDELEAALSRFQKPHPDHGEFASFRKGVDDEPYDAGILYIDLAARLVAVENSYFVPGHRGQRAYRDGQSLTQKDLPFHIHEEWKLNGEIQCWRSDARQRRETRLAESPLDTRKVLYGKLAEFIAQECVELAIALARDAASQANTPTSENDDDHPWQSPPWVPPVGWEFRELAERFADQTEREHEITIDDGIAEIHARWLMTPREDLGGRIPREIMAADREHLSWDMQHRQEQWSILGGCPTPLTCDTHAYLFGGFGTHENVVYYDLVRELVVSCWTQLLDPHSEQRQRLFALAAHHNVASDEVIGLLLAEVERLNQFKQQWLHSPNVEEFSGRIPHEIIEQERLRIPSAMSSHEAIVDCDCPICQMMGDEESPLFSGPMFWGLDGCNMDEDFAFDIWCATREEWDEKQREWEAFNRKFAEEQAAREASGEAIPWEDSDGTGEQNDGSPWERSYSASSVGQSGTFALFGIGAHLAEIITDIKSSNGDIRFVESLNRQYGNLNEALGNPESELVEPVIERFCDELNQLAIESPELTPKADALSRELRGLLRYEIADDEMPF